MTTKQELEQQVKNLERDRDQLIEALAKIYALGHDITYRNDAADNYAPCVVGRMMSCCTIAGWGVRTLTEDEYKARVQPASIA